MKHTNLIIIVLFIFGLGAFNKVQAADYTITPDVPNGYLIPKIIGASAALEDTLAVDNLDYLEWYGITHLRFWIRHKFTDLNWGGGITTEQEFKDAVAAIRENPTRQQTKSDYYFDWESFYDNNESHRAGNYKVTLENVLDRGIEILLVNSTKANSEGLTEWGEKLEYWKSWYAYVYHFSSTYGITKYSIMNEPLPAITFQAWQSHWLVAADAMRAGMADANRDFSTDYELDIYGPTSQGDYWDTTLDANDTTVDGWFRAMSSTAWEDIQTDIYGNTDEDIWNFTTFDYHRYRNDPNRNKNEFLEIRESMANATISPKDDMPIVITEMNTSTNGTFVKKLLDNEDMYFGIGVGGILSATSNLGPAGLGDEGGFFFFKLADATVNGLTTNKSTYSDPNEPYHYGGVTRGGAAFQLYARHFRNSLQVLAFTDDGEGSYQHTTAALDTSKQAYLFYTTVMNDEESQLVLDLSKLDVEAGAPVFVSRIDQFESGQVTDILAVDSDKSISTNLGDSSVTLLWVPKNNAAAYAKEITPLADASINIGSGESSHADQTLQVSLHHSDADKRNISFINFSLDGLDNAYRILFKLSGHTNGVNPTDREILHVYGTSNTWTENSLTWANAPGVGRYSSRTSTNIATDGSGDMIDINDNFEGSTPGTGLGLTGKFLGQVSLFSETYKTNYLDITDYAKEMLAAGEKNITLTIARTVRYNVNNLTGPFYYQTGVYHYDDQLVEIASKENDDISLHPALSVFQNEEFGTTIVDDKISIDKSIPTIDIKTANKNSIVLTLIGSWDSNTSVTIFSANGRQLKQFNSTISKDLKTLNIQNDNGYSNGLYFITISDSKQTITKAIPIFL